MPNSRNRPERPRIFTEDVPCDVPSPSDPWFVIPEHRQVRPDNVRSVPVRPLSFDESTIFRHEDLIGGTVTGRSSTTTRTATVLSKVKNNRNLVGCDTSKSNFCKWEKKVKPVNLLSREYDIGGVPDYV